MSIEEALKRAAAGAFDPAPSTPVTDKALQIFSSDLPFREKWDLISALASSLDRANQDDCKRYGSIIEGMYADAETAEDLQYMNSEEHWPA